MQNKTSPVEPPIGYKWHISESSILGSMFCLQLFPENANVDRNGMAWSEPLKKATEYFAKGCTLPLVASAQQHVVRESGIRRASIKCLKSFERNEARQAVIDRVVSRA